MLQRLQSKLCMPDGSINPWVIAVTVTLATFMEVLDTSIANVALPHIAGNLSRQRRRIHLGADALSGLQCDYPAAFRLVSFCDWPQTLLHGSCRYFHRELRFLCGLAPSLGMLVMFPRHAGRRRRRFAAQRASHPE